ncbi:MAG: PAS domain S-box protein [Nitrospirae bacterium]|nr:PAS domain S-box protein [Nitrospirota bacterium]
MIIASQKSFSDYVVSRDWRKENTAHIKYYHESPKWFLTPSVLRTLVRPRYAMLIDDKGRVREVYSRHADAPTPELLHPARLMMIKSQEQSFVTEINDLHYVISSAPLPDDRGKLMATVMLASPIDEEFLNSSIGVLKSGYLIALVDQDSDQRVLVSNDEKELPPGAHLSDLQGHFIITGQHTYNYGAAEYMINLVSFISRAEADKLTDMVISTGRFQRNIIAPAFILTFAVIMVLITRRINRLNRRMSDFSRETLGAQTEVPAKGDQLYLLEKRFERLTEEVVEAREIIKKQAEEMTLKESHGRLLTVLDSLEAIVYVADMQTHEILFINNYTRKTFGDIEGKICWQALQVDQPGPCGFCSNDKLLTPGGRPSEIYTWEFENTRNGRWYYIKDRAIQWVDGRIVRMEIATDITAIKETETLLIKERNLFRTMIEGLPGAFYIFSDKGKFLRWNRNFREVSGYSNEELASINSLDLFLERDKAIVTKKIAEVFTKGQSFVEATILTKDRREIPYLLTGCRCDMDNTPCLIGLGLDMSEQKKAKDRLMESLREKEILLKEIHHRVKNNMQVISSLLNIQAGKLKGRPEAEVFNESRNRISAMALVHEKLYRSASLGNIDFNDYITSLSNSLFAFYGKSTKNISVKVHADGVFLGIDTAIPCGLIINELLSNSLKYAFPNDRSGNISITLKNMAGGSHWDYELIVRDSGIGLPAGLDIRKTSSLGLQLVINLSEHQLQGAVENKLYLVGNSRIRQVVEPAKEVYKSNNQDSWANEISRSDIGRSIRCSLFYLRPCLFNNGDCDPCAAQERQRAQDRRHFLAAGNVRHHPWRE